MKGIKQNSGKTFSLDFYKWFIILRVKDYGKMSAHLHTHIQCLYCYDSGLRSIQSILFAQAKTKGR